MVNLLPFLLQIFNAIALIILFVAIFFIIKYIKDINEKLKNITNKSKE